MSSADTAPCDSCGRDLEDALARIIELEVDGKEVDRQRLCPDCFADWITRYDDEMRSPTSHPDDRGDIIVD